MVRTSAKNSTIAYQAWYPSCDNWPMMRMTVFNSRNRLTACTSHSHTLIFTMKWSYVVNCASMILTKIEAMTARESPLSMTLVANVSIPNHDKCTGEKCQNSKVSLYVTIVLSKTLSISVHVGKYHDPTGTLCKNVSLVQKSRRTSIERSFFCGVSPAKLS
jgi:hypothetical protein